MIRVVVEINKRRCGSMWLHDDNTTELHAVDHAAFLEALALAVGSLQGREHVVVPETRQDAVLDVSPLEVAEDAG